MADDFAPTKTTEEVDRWEGQRQRTRFYPAVDSCCLMVYINTSAGSEAAVQETLDRIAGQCEEYAQLAWHPTAEPNCDPSVDLRVTVRTDDHAPE